MLATCIIAVVGLSYAGILDQYYLKIQSRKLADIYVPRVQSLLKIGLRRVGGIYIPTALTAEEEHALRPGDRFQECASCPEMVVIPAGEFMMGSEQGDKDEKPVHRVAIGKPFAVGRFSVTFDEWDGCIAHGGCTYRPGDNGWERERHPVIKVSWHDLKEYLAWLSKQTGKTYRLLTEAEWEYAARAGTTTSYPWGEKIGKGNANCDGCGSQWENKETARVGSFKPNAFGLYEMHGNVWQWVEDCYHNTYQDAPADGSAWIQDCDDGSRVRRGGSWNSLADLSRSPHRNRYPARGRFDILGFRVGRTLTP